MVLTHFEKYVMKSLSTPAYCRESIYVDPYLRVRRERKEPLCTLVHLRSVGGYSTVEGNFPDPPVGPSTVETNA